LRSKETLQRLLKALDELLVDNDFDQVNVVDICAKAGASVGRFYRRFKSKDELLPYLYKIAKYEYFNWFQTLIEKSWHGDLNSRIEQLIQATIWYHQQTNAFLLPPCYIPDCTHKLPMDSDAKCCYISNDSTPGKTASQNITATNSTSLSNTLVMY
jgi:AcrR family transcriptional regulator